jgi:hypothetical protein
MSGLASTARSAGVNRIFLIGLALSLTPLLQNCAKVEVNRVTAYDQPGIRYWRPAPYLALQPSTTGTTTTCEEKLVMLPDKSEEYAITMSAGYGTAEADPTLQDGWNLTAMTGKADSKTADTLTALASVIKTLPINTIADVHGKAAKSKAVRLNCSGLYRLRYERGELVGFDPIPLPGKLVVAAPVSAPPVDKPKCGKSGEPCSQ